MPVVPRASSWLLVGLAAILLGMAVVLLLPEARRCALVDPAGLVGIVDDVVPMPDGGFVQVGFDHVQDADWDLLVIRSNADGSFRWAKRCGGSERDLAKTVVPREDGGMLVVGQTRSGIAWRMEQRVALFNAWLLSFDADGRLLWQRAYGGPVQTSADVASQERDGGGYLLFGHRRSPADPLKRQRWLLRVGPEGEELWSRIVGFGFLALPRPGGLEVLAGQSSPNVIGLHFSRTPPELDWWLARVSWAGDVDWSWTLRLLPRELHPDLDSLRASSIAPARDGGYLLGGDLRVRGPRSVWVMKVDAEGRLVWRRTFDAAGGPNGAVVLPLRDGGAYLAGRAGEESKSFWAARLAGDGEVVWQRTFVRGTPYAATLGRGERLVIAGIAREPDRQALLLVTPEGDASLMALPGE
jgi:outer membrane protein assembly factor BamB